MIEYKQGSAANVPVRIQTSAGVAIPGTLYTAVTATVLKSDGTTAVVVMSAGNWTEVTTGAFAGTGTYTLGLSSSQLGTVGVLMYAVAVSGALTYVGVVKVVANEEADTYARLGSPTGASIAADISSVWDADLGLHAIAGSAGKTLSTINTTATNTWNFHTSEWQVVATGADANRMVVTMPGLTLKFDLKDKDGNPTYINPFVRIPV